MTVRMQTILEIDARLSQQLRRAENPGSLRRISILLAHSGDSWFWLAGLGLFWLLGGDYWRFRAEVFGIGIFITAIIVMLIKFSVRRRRPVGEWGSIYRNTDPHSFPSGHAARVMMLGVLTLGLGPVWLAILLLIWAPLVMLARVAMGVHYLSDVVVGALLGFMMAILILYFL